MKFIVSFFIFIITLGTSCYATPHALTKYLLPQPRNISVQPETFTYSAGRIICNELAGNPDLKRIAFWLQDDFKKTGMDMQLAATTAKQESPVVLLQINKLEVKEQQGYSIEINEKQIILTGHDLPGLYYASLTMTQILKFASEQGGIPQLTISDYPDFPNRGVMMDVSRDKVPTMETLFDFIDQLASWKVNQFQLYSEHTFAYQDYKQVWQHYSALSADEILQIDEYCRERFIELVPNQNSLGHMERWLEHSTYHHLAERPEIEPTEDIVLKIRRTLNATSPDVKTFMAGLYDELLPNFSSTTVNIGGDEPYELGLGKSKGEADKIGKGKVYLNYIKAMHSLLKERNYNVQFWGDIILKHPVLIPELPEDITCMIWGYRATHPYPKQCSRFQEANIPFYVCPGSSSWRSVVGRIENSLENQLAAAENGLKYGAIGYLNTDWGDYGHWQPHIVSYPAYIYGAGLSWAVEANKNIDVAELMNKYILLDRTNQLQKLIFRLGNVNQMMQENPFNMAFYQNLRFAGEPMSSTGLKGMDTSKIESTIAEIQKILLKIETTQPVAKDGVLIKKELKTAGELAIHSCHLALAKLQTTNGTIEEIDAGTKAELARELNQINADFRENWLKRFRIGGLMDSQSNFNTLMEFYNTKN